MKTLRVVIFLNILSVLLFANKTYEIIEQDLISEIENKAPELELKLQEQKKIIIEKVENIKGEELTPAIKSKINYIDPTYTLDKDIPKYNKFGQKEGILYKKGYKFNPIDLINVLPPDFIIFNPCNEKESEYVKDLVKDYENNHKDYMLVNSGCKNKELKDTDFYQKVYFLTKEMKDKFKVKHTISIIYVDKNIKKIVVKEVNANEKDIN